MIYEAILFETPEDAMPVRRTVEVFGEAEAGTATVFLQCKFPRCEIISIKEKPETETL